MRTTLLTYLKFRVWLFKMRRFSPIYVDTSALVSMPVASFRKLSHRHFTSALALLEIMTNHFRTKDEMSFRVMKSRITNINHVRLKMDWRLTEEVFNEAFPNVRPKKIRAGNLHSFYDIVLESSTMASFWDHIHEQHLEDSVNEAIAYDDFLGSGLTRPERIRAFKTVLSQGVQNGNIVKFYYRDGEPLPSSPNDFFRDMSTRKLEDGRTFILKSLLMRREYPDKTQNPLAGYNGEMELFLSASAYHLFSRAITQANYRRNDMIDLFHFVYVGGNVRILTKENILIEYTKMFQPASLVPFSKYETKNRSGSRPQGR